MIIEWEGREYEYDPRAIDVKTAIKIREHVGCGLQSWAKLIDDADPVALQALLWAVKQQNGEAVPIKTLHFSVLDFFEAVVDAARREVADRVAEAIAEGDDEPDPTVTG